MFVCVRVCVRVLVHMECQGLSAFKETSYSSISTSLSLPLYVYKVHMYMNPMDIYISNGDDDACQRSTYIQRQQQWETSFVCIRLYP